MLTSIPLLLALLTPAGAPPRETDAAGLFTVGNVLFATLHEIGHALIEDMDLPILGNGEAAADSIAALLMIPRAPNPFRRRLIIAATRGWEASVDLQGSAPEGASNEFWDIHVRDAERRNAALCLLVGSDTRASDRLAERAGMTADDVALCEDAYANTSAAFERLTQAHRRLTGRAGGGRIAVLYDPDPAFAFERGLMQGAGSVGRALDDLAGAFVLPDDITVRFQGCGGEINAWWSPLDRTVEVCYELVAYFHDLAPFDAERPPSE